MKIYLFLIFVVVVTLLSTKTYDAEDCRNLCGDKNIKSCCWIKIECNAPEPILDCE